MNKIFRLLNSPSAGHIERNGFDQSQRNVFSMKAGQILPVVSVETVPNGYYEINPVDLVRTTSFNELNFCRLKQSLDFFFVPYTSIFRSWQEFYQSTTDPYTASGAGFTDVEVGSKTVTSVPNLSLYSLVTALMHAAYLDSDWTNSLGFDNEVDGAFTQYLANTAGLVATPSNYMQFFYRDGSVVKDIHGYSRWQGTIRLLDLLGYGNFLPLCKIDPTKFSVDAESTKVEAQLTRVLSSIKDKYVNVWRLAAYQAVCQRFFWNKTYSKPLVASYNFDDIVSRAGVPDIDNIGYNYSLFGRDHLFEMNYKPWRYDIFTGSLPSPQFGDVSVVSSTYVGIDGNITGSSNRALYVKASLASAPAGVEPGQAYAATSASAASLGTLRSDFSVLDFRKAEALQKWREAIGRAGYRSSDRFEATFGVRPKAGPGIDIIPLGSLDADVMKDAVTGTAGDEFAEQAATGSSTLGGRKIEFHASDFGVIIGVMSIDPIAEYDAYGMDVHNIKLEAFDYFTPAFQNLGLQPVYAHEISLYGSGTTGHDTILGYVPRYAEYKQKVDKVHGEFCTNPLGLPESAAMHPIGEFETFVATRIDLETWNGSVQQYYVDPAVLDHIFVSASDASQSTDQFHVNLYCEIRSVQPMSVLGLPQY